MVFRKRGMRKLKRRPTFARKRTRTVSQAVKKYVKSTIHKQIENKCVQINGGTGFGNVLQSPVMNAYPMQPLSGYWNITQGTGAGARIGNQIRVRKLELSYVLRPMPYEATNNPAPMPCEIQLMLGYVKSTPSYAPVALDISQLFQSGNSVSAPVGSLRDIIAVINKDYWEIKKRWTHKVGYSTSNGTGSQSANQFFANNDFKLNVVKKINITKFVPTTCLFNDAGITPTTRNLFFMYQAVAASGEILPATRIPMTIDFWLDFRYEDA